MRHETGIVPSRSGVVLSTLEMHEIEVTPRAITQALQRKRTLKKGHGTSTGAFAANRRR